MKRVALALAVFAVGGMMACDSDGGLLPYTPTAPAEAPAVAPGPVQTPAPGPLTAPPGNGAPSLSIRTLPKEHTGPRPFDLVVRMCESSDPDQDHLNYLYKWGDNEKDYEEHAGFCSMTHTYRKAGRYRATFCVDDGYPDHQVCDDFRVTVQ